MTPKEKAIELIEKFRQATYLMYAPSSMIKQCASVCVDEILKIDAAGYRVSVDSDMDNDIYIGFRDYWQEVKEEIEKL